MASRLDHHLLIALALRIVSPIVWPILKVIFWALVAMFAIAFSFAVAAIAGVVIGIGWLGLKGYKLARGR